MGKQEDFIKRIAPLAVLDMKASGILASVTIAQAILESAWGTSELSVNANNLFGMKASLSGNTWKGTTWAGDIYSKKTGEQKKDGTYYNILADFRLYRSIELSVGDHSAYLIGAMNGKKRRYEGVEKQTDPRKALHIIKDGGYATSLDYVDNLMRIVIQYDLTKYDKRESEDKTMGKKIMLDAGHAGKYNRSPANKAYYESDFNWKLQTKLKKYLEGFGFTVCTTRASQNTDRDLFGRGKASAGYDLFLSLHSNAVGSGVNDTVDYPVVYTLLNDKSTLIDDVSRDIGTILAGVIEKTMGTKQKGRTATRRSDNDRNGDGILNDEYYGVLYGAKAVGTAACIIEHSFHTNTRSTNWLLSDDNVDKLAKAEATAIADYFGHEKKPTAHVEDKKETPKEDTTLNTSVTGSLEVLVKDLEVHNTPDLNEGSRNRTYGPVGPGTGKGVFFTVVGKTKNGLYKLKSGLYITASEKYVRFTPNEIYKDYKVGDKVTFSGTLYGNGNGTGGTTNKVGATMYVSDIVSKDKYQYYIGLSMKPGSARIGWTKPSTLS